MLGEVYLAGALAIFFAVFGWSESIFGLSAKTKEKEAEFLKRTKLTEIKYKRLKNIISKSKELDSGTFLKDIMAILKGTRLFKGGKRVFDTLRENDKSLENLKRLNSYKYSCFVVLFLFLFVAGTTMLIFENSSYTLMRITIGSLGMISLDILLTLSLQLILLIIIIIGFVIYLKIKDTEKKIQNNLNSLIKMGEDE